MKRYREKSYVSNSNWTKIEIEALEWNGSNINEIKEFCRDKVKVDLVDIMIKLLNVGDFVIKGLNGGIRSYRSDIFKETYEEISE